MKKKKAEPESKPRRRRWAGADPKQFPPDVQRSRLAFRIREIYIRERSASEQLLFGGEYRYRPPRSYDGPHEMTEQQVAAGSVWYKMMVFYVAHKIDEHAFIAYMFGRAEPGGRLPEPNMLYGPKSLAKWEKAQAEKGREIETTLVVQRRIAMANIAFLQRLAGKSATESFERTIVDTTLALSGLFRYCLASSIPGKRFRRLAAYYEGDACLQFERYRKYYKRHWKDFLPVGFIKRSRKVYAMLFGGTDAQREGQEE